MSIRMRLAVWVAALVTVSGAIVVVAVVALSGRLLHDAARPKPLPPGVFPGTPAAEQFNRGQQGRAAQSALDEARLVGLGALGALALCSVGIGWLVAGRMVRPVHVLAETAHEISDTSLDRRIALAGPEDELKELADAFDGMLDRLDAAFAAQRRFVADASHELRTPLATIRAELDAGLDEGVAERIQGVLDRADALVEALLTLSRSDAVTATSRVDLGEVAREVVTATPGVASLDVRLDLADAPVAGDRVLLERLVGNLVENAARYNVPGGLLAVRTATQNGRAVLSVENDGPQVPAEELGSLTERFHRRERTGRGFGLGLAIAEATARGHGGTLSLRARPAGGLEAVAELPSAPRLQSPSQPS